MARHKIDELLVFMDRAFADSENGLLNNLATVREESWEALPEGGVRTIRDIVRHVGMFKFMYANHGFGDGELDYSDPPATPARSRVADLDAAVRWLRDGHKYLTECIRQLADDSELDALRKAHWGEQVPTRHLIVTMIEHDLYHAGEINRSMALLQDDDAWFIPERR